MSFIVQLESGSSVKRHQDHIRSGWLAQRTLHLTFWVLIVALILTPFHPYSDFTLLIPHLLMWLLNHHHSLLNLNLNTPNVIHSVSGKLQTGFSLHLIPLIKGKGVYCPMSFCCYELDLCACIFIAPLTGNLSFLLLIVFLLNTAA